MANEDIFGGNQSTDTNAGNPNPSDQDNPFESLVGEGKKFKTPEDLARGKIEADNYIQQLTDALKDASEELGKQDHVQQLLDELRSRQHKTPDTAGKDDAGSRGTENPDQTGQQFSEEKLQSLVEKTLTERERKSTSEGNLQKSISAVTEKVGADKAREYIQEKAKELGLSPERLRSVAEESPSAFAELVGLNKQAADSSRPKNTLRPEGMGQMNNPEERTNAWYINLRRTNRSEYYKPATQARMYKDRERLGDKFWQ